MEVAAHRFDLAIVGGGPAGTAAAITAARQGASVAVLEAGEFPRQKVCGEFVSAESLHLLRELLAGQPRAAEVLRRAPEIGTVRLCAYGRVLEASVAPPGLSLPRYDLDSLLWSAAQQAGACAYSRCEVRSLETGSRFAITTSVRSIEAKAVIVCAGRWSRFSGRDGIPPGPRWVGVKAHYRESNPPPSTDLYFFHGGYCGVQPIAANAVNACAMVRSDRATDLEGVFRLSPELARRTTRWERLTIPVSTSPLVYRKPAPVRAEVLYAGDAAGFIDPFAGDGISLALRSGVAAASCLLEFVAGRQTLAASAARYEQIYSHRFAPLLANAARVRRLVTLPRPAHLLLLQVLRVPGLMPYLVRKTRVG